jgi:hypothetical protein
LVFSLFATLPAVVISLFFILLSAIKGANNRQDKRWDYMLVASVLIIPISTLGMETARRLSPLVPYKYDEYAFVFDARFGQLSFRLGQFFASSFWLQTALAAIYNMLPLGFLSVYGAHLFNTTKEGAAEVLRTYILLFLLIVPLYLVFPVCGPLYAFPGFPFEMPAHLVPHALRLDAAPNGVPSGHVAAALATFYYSRRWKLGLLLSTPFLFLTMIATLESGEHYLFDLICAVPFTALVLWVSRGLRQPESVRSSDNSDPTINTRGETTRLNSATID